MEKLLLLLALCLAAPLLLPLVRAQSCSSFNLNATYVTCLDLGKLNAFLHWNYTAAENKVDIAFRAQQGSSGYIAWGLNPSGSRMIDTETIVALQNSSTVMWAYTTYIQSKQPDMNPSTLPTITVTNPRAVLSGEYMVIYATVALPANMTTISHVWQTSTSKSSSGLPSGHTYSGDNLLSLGTINFLSGEATASSNSVNRRRNVHGILNGIAWGVMMPMGVIFARYVKVFADPAWFYLHITCQIIAYGVGVAGVATGIKLGNDSDGIVHKTHRYVGIALLCMATLQVSAMFLRPNKDHKYRFFWNIYHRSIGYAVVVMSALNIFEGFEILDREDNWKKAYIIVLATLAGIAVVLEAFTWIVVLRRKHQPDHSNGVAAGYGATRHV